MKTIYKKACVFLAQMLRRVWGVRLALLFIPKSSNDLPDVHSTSEVKVRRTVCVPEKPF